MQAMKQDKAMPDVGTGNNGGLKEVSRNKVAQGDGKAVSFAPARDKKQCGLPSGDTGGARHGIYQWCGGGVDPAAGESVAGETVEGSSLVPQSASALTRPRWGRPQIGRVTVFRLG